MAQDVLITPGSGIVEFKNDTVTDATIQITAGGDLEISATGDISIGDASSDLYIGDGVNNVDIIFEQSGEIRGLTGVAITLGQADSSIQMGTDLNLNNKSITNIAGATFASGTVDFNTSATVNFNKAQGTSPFTVDSSTTVTNLSADLLDGVDSGGFLRSNTSDNYTSGTLTFNAGTTVAFANTTGTAPFTVASTTVVTNLNADLLDGQTGSYYLNWTNISNKPDPIITLTGAVTGSGTMTDLGNVSIATTATSDPTLTINGDASGSATFTNLGNATLTLTIADDSHNHTIANVDNLQTSLDGKLSTSGGTLSGSLTIGDGTADTRLIIKRVDGTTGDDIQFFNGTTRVGEIGTSDTTWLRINQDTNKNIYTPRYIRADAGFFVDGTAKGIDGTGNLIGMGTGSFSGQVTSTLAAGTAPFVVASDTVVANLNADKLDGYDSTDFFRENLGEISNGATQDFNNFTASGSYYVVNWSDPADVIANGPSGSYPWGCLKVTQFNGPNYVLQEYWPHNTDISWSRVNWAGTWTAWRESWGSGNDGSGSGLDADLLDGQQGSYYLDWTNVTNKPTLYAEPGIFSGGGTPTLASGVTGAEIRTLIGAGTGSGTVTSVQVSAGGGLTGGGTVTTSGTITISHLDTSTQASVDNSAGNVIQDITLDTYGHITGIASVDLDGRYYTESEVNSFINRSYISANSKTNLAVGWYTIATNTGDRATARFGIWDTNSSDHQSVTFYAAHHFGTNESNTLTVLDNSYFSGNPFRYIRIKDGATYDGAALQIYIDDATNTVNAAILGDNFQSSGWVLKDWIADGTDPGDVDNWAAFTEASRIDLNQIAQGGFATTGEIYAGGDTSQNRVFHDGYHPNADKWTTGRTITLTGDVTGTSGSFDGSGNLSFATTVTDDSHTHDGRYYTETEVNNLLANYAKRYSATPTINQTSYTTVATVVGDRLGSGITIHVNGTSNNVVVAVTAEIIVNHSADIIVKSLSGNYTPLYIQIISDGNEDFAINLKVGGAIVGNTTVSLDIYTRNNETVTFTATNPYSITTHEHLTKPGAFISASDAGAADYTVEDNFYVGSDRVFHDGYHPNADKWTTARTLSLTGAVTGSASIDGSGNVSLATTATSDPTLTLSGDATGSATFTNLGNATLTVAVVNDSHDHTTSISGSAAKWTTARTLSLTGAVTGSASIDGSGNVSLATTATSDPTLTLSGDATGSATFTNLGNATLTVTVVDDSHTHDTRYYTETEADSRFVNVTGDTMTGQLTMNNNIVLSAGNDITGGRATTTATSTILQGVFNNPADEDKAVQDPRLVNDLAGANRWATIENITGLYQTRSGTAGSFTYSNPVTSASGWASAFDGLSSTAGSWYSDNGVNGTTQGEGSFEINFNGVKELTYTCFVGIVFGSSSFVARRVKIETFRNSAWQTECDLTDNTSVVVLRQVSGNNQFGVQKIRYTLGSSDVSPFNYFRIHTLFAANYAAGLSGGARYYGINYMPKYSDAYHHGHLIPGSDNTYTLGNTTYKYNYGYINEISGSAAKWTTARTLSLTGAVTGSASIDGSGNVSLATTATSDPTLTINGDASGSATFTNLGNATLTLSVNNDSHYHTYLQAVDDRDVKPNTSGVGNGVLGMRAFFTTLEGMTGSAGTNYQDLLVLDTYSDTSGGNANAITIDKSDGIMRLWNAAHNTATWGTPKEVSTQDRTNTVVARYTTAATATGRIRITLPFNTNANQMIKFTISQYSSYVQHTYEVSGYLYNTNNQWYLPKAVYSGTGSPDIIVGRATDGKAYVSLANGNYTGIIVHSVTAGYTMTEAETYAQGWSIAPNNNTENSVTVTVTNLASGGSTVGPEFTVTAGTAGDARLIIEADTDNNDENDHPSIRLKQDGALVDYRIGIGATDADTGANWGNKLVITKIGSADASTGLGWSPDGGTTVEPILTGNITGTLFADVIAANEIYADMIAANAITAQKIQANAVTANELEISSTASVANSIFFDGTNKRIDIKDASGVLRVRIGQL